MDDLTLIIIGFVFLFIILLFLTYWFYVMKSKGLGARRGKR